MEQTGIVSADANSIKENEKESASFYESIAFGGPAMQAIIHFPDTRVTFVNKQFQHYLGYSNADLASRPVLFSDLLEEYQLDRFLFQITSADENIQSQSRYVIYRLKNKSGETAAFYLYAAPFSDINEDLSSTGTRYMLTLLPDLSKWDMPFTSFTTRELFLEHFNSENFGTFEWLLSIDKVFWSAGVYHIYEIDNVHQRVSIAYERSLIHPSDRQRVEEEMKKAIESGNDLNTEYKIVTEKQTIKIIHCLARVSRNAVGAPVKFAGSIRDVTAQRAIEENLRNNVNELYHSNKELEEFAYIASHDMQEPLRKISIFSDRLSERYKDVLTGDGAMYLTRMIASTQNMRSLIEDLLQFSKVTKTSQPFETVKLNEVLRHATSDLELIIEETGCTIVNDSLPEVEAIASQMKQVFTNLISNAIKFHKPDVAPVITIEASEATADEKLANNFPINTLYYKIQFTDNGIGFEEEYAVKIFQVFQRLHGKSEYPGSGIGLAICKKILEFHNGIIYAENIPDKGSRFVFMLPARQPQSKTLNP